MTLAAIVNTVEIKSKPGVSKIIGNWIDDEDRSASCHWIITVVFKYIMYIVKDAAVAARKVRIVVEGNNMVRSCIAFSTPQVKVLINYSHLRWIY